VTENAPTRIIVHRSGSVVFANPAAVKMLGAASERDMLGMGALNLVSEEGHEDILAKRVECVGQEDYAGYLRHQRVRLDR
jgi:PAS domain S-box-containing protein